MRKILIVLFFLTLSSTAQALIADSTNDNSLAVEVTSMAQQMAATYDHGLYIVPEAYGSKDSLQRTKSQLKALQEIFDGKLSREVEQNMFLDNLVCTRSVVCCGGGGTC